MAKSKTKTSKLVLSARLTKYKKESAGIALVVLLLLIAVTLVFNNRKDATTKVTSTRDLAKSTVNTNNTKETKTATSTAPTDASTTANTPTSTATTTKKSPTSNTTTPTAAPVSSGSSSSSSPSAPSVVFKVNDGPYTEVDNSYTEIGCSQSARFTFSSTITANAAGTVTYHWERSDGASTSNRQLVFGGAGMQTVTNTWDLSSDATPGTYSVHGWQKMVITSPNETSSKASDTAFTLAVGC